MADNDEHDLVGEGPPVIDPYDTLDLDRSASAEQVRSAYRKAALKNHPDKVPEDEKSSANERFQAIAFAYAILSDPNRRERYDKTGSTEESIVDSDGFDWSDFYRAQFQDAVSDDAIQEFAAKYKGSDEEKDDLLVAYEQSEGDMDAIYEHVILSNVLEDDARFRSIIDEAIASKDVPKFKAYAQETTKKRNARMRVAKAEKAEAEDYARELGVHDKLFGDRKSGKDKQKSEDSLAALIQKRQQDRSESFLDNLAEKYGAKSGSSNGKNGKKRPHEDEPSEEAFQAAAARLKSSKAGKKKL